MHDVMTIKRQTRDGLVCGTRAAERIAGMALSVSALVLAWIMGYAGNRNRAERLARTIAAFTEAAAIDSDGLEMKNWCAAPPKVAGRHGTA